jgi:cell division protein FtsQ
VRAAAAVLGRRGLPRMADALRRAAASVPLPAWSPRLRRRLLLSALLCGLLALAYMSWFRDSSFVRVERVAVTGLSGTDAPRQRADLIAAAKRMTTLHVDQPALRHALGAGATVEAVRVTTDFPHGLRVDVVEKAPVAVLAYGSQRVAVGSGGVLLPGVEPIPRDLPAVDVGALPSGQRLGRGRARRLVAAAAAAPVALRARVGRLRELAGKGLVAYLDDGPQVILGSAADLDAKWTAAAAILADGESHGASYIDVRLPDRPVAGGLELPPPPPDEQPGAVGSATSATSGVGNAPPGAGPQGTAGAATPGAAAPSTTDTGVAGGATTGSGTGAAAPATGTP